MKPLDAARSHYISQSAISCGNSVTGNTRAPTISYYFTLDVSILRSRLILSVEDRFVCLISLSPNASLHSERMCIFEANLGQADVGSVQQEVNKQMLHYRVECILKWKWLKLACADHLVFNTR